MDGLAGSRQQDRGGPSKYWKVAALLLYNAHSLLSNMEMWDMWLTVRAQMLLYADKWLEYTRTIHIALKLLKNESWFFKDYKLL